ncbi:winged helix-turn-helix domain-containing protein [Mycolicibacterium peregrinum]|uniref:winged helix-turn-helix domain-containing protein n=1 Tax=Mycolicibacterium peregrinum TaxID=43304 RepID=UPI000B4BCF1F|nr:winged helix-turn-helix domain-containing protein [Mycolicibacterium peregrinum]
MTSVAEEGKEAVKKRLAIDAARLRTYKRYLERSIYEAATRGGLSQREISDLVGTHSQPTVQRILRRFTDDPDQLQVKPAELIDLRTAGLIDTETMMKELLDWQYSFGGVVRIGGVATDAYMSRDWDEIEMAFYRGLLTDDEFERLAHRHLTGA